MIFIVNYLQGFRHLVVGVRESGTFHQISVFVFIYIFLFINIYV